MERKSTKWVVQDPSNSSYYWPSEELKKASWINDPSVYEEAEADPVNWWCKLAKSGLTWFEEWKTAYLENAGKIRWFDGGKLNLCYNAVDRHIQNGKKDKVAIFWEPEDLASSKRRSITYGELLTQVNKLANVFKSLGIKKGDAVAIYLPMIPEAIIAMLACCRIGAIHAVVFSAFTKLPLNNRLISAKAKLLITADGYFRRGKPIGLKVIAESSLNGTAVEHVLVVKRSNLPITMQKGRDLYWDDVLASASSTNEPEKMDSEDPLFVLYTSGTTGKPKGIVHTTGGYTVCAYWTTKLLFNIHDDDVYFCTADIGWITGHTYNCYGPLLNGTTLLMYEGAPDFPTYDRWWDIIERYKATVFYTAPTAIRMLKKQGNELPNKHDLSSLRILASVGEPINEEAWRWYFNVIGGARCPIIDTWWQTETGSIMVSALPGVGPFICGVAGRAFPGVSTEVVSDQIAPVTLYEPGLLLLKAPFPPSIFRTIHEDNKRYQEQFRIIGGGRKYFSNDGAMLVDSEIYIKVTGRLDDVMKVAGHALSTADLENALCKHPAVAEAAVVSIMHEIKYEVPLAFIVLKEGEKPGIELEVALKKKTDELIGPIARPDKIVFVEDLPKTRSGKILRRMLKDLVRLQPIGDVTTLMNPDSIQHIRTVMGLPKSPHTAPGKPESPPIPVKKLIQHLFHSDITRLIQIQQVFVSPFVVL
eukprot:TRINITY_DN20723_c0_g1_i1.p1 TRINITY_DN20723_c0_g1~~TRINITY_DN20723_c0_g1_i1.p1  ORF type:complete len:702 (-),score=34.27 TRINITY_DN20723_c0_g1_i1:4449-6554(-)